jgi:hypothetical protein
MFYVYSVICSLGKDLVLAKTTILYHKMWKWKNGKERCSHIMHMLKYVSSKNVYSNKHTHTQANFFFLSETGRPYFTETKLNYSVYVPVNFLMLLKLSLTL